MTLRCVPAFTIRRHDHPLPLDETLARLDELAAAQRPLRVLRRSRTRDVALCRESSDLDGAAASRAAASPSICSRTCCSRTTLFGCSCRVGRRFPSRDPADQPADPARSPAARVKIDRSYKVFSTTRLVRFTEMEYAIPRAAGPEALRRVLEMIERRGFAVPFPIEFRFVAPDDAYLSTAYGRDTCLHRGPHVPRHGLGAVLPRGRGDHGRLRRAPALGQAPLPVGRDARAALPGVGPLPGRAGAARPRGVFQNEYAQRVLGRGGGDRPGLSSPAGGWQNRPVFVLAAKPLNRHDGGMQSAAAS